MNSRKFAVQDGFTAVHYAAEISAEQLHFPGEDAKLMNLLIDYGGQVRGTPLLIRDCRAIAIVLRLTCNR